MNDYIKYYETNKISPVKQNIDNFTNHINRRIALLRQLGIHPMAIENRSILEVGCGGGYNSLAIYSLNPSKYTLVEPNTTGFNELVKNFKEKGFKDNVSFNNCLLEDFNSNEKFDIIFCEGLVQGLNDSENFLKLLKGKLNSGGIIVFTVGDEITVFFEIVKRYFANVITKDITDFNQKINLLVRLFNHDLSSLGGMTRKHSDWCADLMCDAYYNHTFSINDAINIFKDDCYFMGSSPNIFQDIRWYKKLPEDTVEYNNVYIKQFRELRHSLIYSSLEFSKRDIRQNNELSILCKRFINIIKLLDKNADNYTQKDLLKNIEDIQNNIKGLDNNIDNAIIEFISILKKDYFTFDDIQDLKYLPKCFGKGQIYLSFTKE